MIAYESFRSAEVRGIKTGFPLFVFLFDELVGFFLYPALCYYE